MELKRADVVISTAGHDRGGYYLVTQAGADRVLLADGKNRRVDKPKQKNPAHVRFAAESGLTPEACAGITNRQLRELLAAIKAGAVI